jgi:ADP-heptose:LPS heptosyltransferase
LIGFSVKPLPDYRWPVEWLGRGYAPWRWLAAGVFHAARAVGRVVGVLTSRRAALAIVRTDGVGDAILFEPSIDSLARLFDRRPVHLWAPPASCDLLRGHPSVARFIQVPRGFKQGNQTLFWSLPWRARMGYRLGRWRYDVVLYPVEDPEPLGNWLAGGIVARQRWLTDGSTLNQFDWQRDATLRRTSSVLRIAGDGHELARNAHLATQWGASIDGIPPQLPLNAGSLTFAAVNAGAARHAVRRARAEGLIGVILEGSTPLKRYPPERFAAVIRQLWLEHQLLCGLISAPQDDAMVGAVTSLLGDVPYHRFPTSPDIAVAAGIVAKVDGLISVDTGLAHAAAAFDVPSVILNSGSMPGRFFPWPAGLTRSITLTVPTACAGCAGRCTQTTPICITTIEPDDVVEALLAVMRRPATRDTVRLHSLFREYRHAG